MAKYSAKFKLEVVKYYLEKNCGYVNTANHFGNISDVAVLKWVRKYKEHGEKGFYKNKKSSYSGEFKHNVTAYIAGITKNLILKKARQQKFLENIEEYQEKLANIQNIELDYVESQKNKIIINELEKMKKEDREIFTEYYYEERKIKEISIMFKISESKVKSKLFRIRKKLKNILKEGGYDVNG